MRKRTRVLLIAGGVIAGGALAVVTAVFVLTGTSWGHDRLRGLIVRQIAAQLAPGATVSIKSLDGGLDEVWTVNSVTLRDARGAEVLSIARLSMGLALPSLAWGSVNLGVITIDGLHARIVQAADGSWNVTQLFASTTATPAPPSAALTRGAPARHIVADSIDVRNSTVDLSMPDSSPRLPHVQRSFSRIRAAFGTTTIRPGDATGGSTTLRSLAMLLDLPPVTVVSAHGTLRWWSDSLLIDLPAIRLPASVARARGTVAWPTAKPTQVAFDIRADSMGLTDIQWISKLVPSTGLASAHVTVATAAHSGFRYDVSNLDLRADSSHVNGGFTVTPGNRTEVRNLALTFTPLDLALVRDVFGDSILKSSWRGALTGSVAGRGGFLDSLLIDSVDAVFNDARRPGARSHVSATGAVDVAGAGTRLIGMAVRVDTLDVHTLGAVAHAADSLSGVLIGHLTLDGPTSNLRFTNLRLQHVDGDRARSTFTGAGRLASDIHTRWLEATLSLDTVAVATLMRDLTTVPLRGTAHGTLALQATGDTLGIDAALASDSATLHLTGTTLLDSTRTQLAMAGTISRIDPRAFAMRRDIPAASLTGRMAVSVDDHPGAPDRHVELYLDSTSRIGDSRIVGAAIRFGIDGAGFHVDTADIRAENWLVEARGKIASDSTKSDTLTFRAAFDSLGVLRSLVLDSTGAPKFQTVEGRLRVDSGTVIGSFAHMSLNADVGGTGLRVGTTSAGIAIGTVDLHDLPHHATGTIRGSVSTLISGSMTMDTVSLAAALNNGDRARVGVRGAIGDSVDVSGTADITWPDSLIVARVDSLSASIRGHEWRLALPATVRQRTGGFDVDSIVMHSDHDAVVVAGGTMPDRDPIVAHAFVRKLGFAEIAFLGLLPPDMTGVINGSMDVTGTRDAPVMKVTASVDSIRSSDRARPSLTLDGTYADRKASIVFGAMIGGRRVLDAHGDIPLDLTLRTVTDRIIEAPMAMHLVADSLALADFDGLAPRVRGLAGTLQAAVDVVGTLRHPRGRGTLTIANGTFELPRLGFVAHGTTANLELAGDSVIIRQLRMNDTDSPQDTASLTGTVVFAGQKWSEWTIDLHSVASSFRVMDDPRLATAEADWQLAVTGHLAHAQVSGNVQLPYAVFTIGPQRRARVVAYDSTGVTRLGVPTVNGVIVSLGSDVRLKSKDANVQLTGEVELFGALNKPWISGSVRAERGTYRVDLGLIKRTFHVDSGSVILEGTPDVAPALDIYTSYTVRRVDNDDILVSAHVYGTTDRPRLDLTSDLGTAVSQSEIISYLVFGQSSFGVPSSRQGIGQTATAAIVPSLGGFLEGALGTVLPFFSTLQVSTVASTESQNIIASPVEGLLNNNYAITGGRQIGSDTFFSLTAGRCTGGSGALSSSVPLWFGTAAEYRPKRTVGASVSIDPGPAPCSRVGTGVENYQIGVDLSYDWIFRRRP